MKLKRKNQRRILSPKNEETLAPPPETDSELIRDTEELLDKVLVAEATEEVWREFDESLSLLNEDSAALLQDYMNGLTPKKLSEKNHCTEAEMKECIATLKRELLQNLRKKICVRH